MNLLCARFLVVIHLVWLQMRGEAFLHLDHAIMDVVQADSTRDIVVFHDHHFNDTVSRLLKRLFQLNCKLASFQLNSALADDGVTQPIIHHLTSLSKEFRTIMTINLLRGNANLVWLSTLTNLPILKRPNKHVFVIDNDNAMKAAFRGWQDEVVATILLASPNRPLSTIEYVNLPCDIDDPIREKTRCRLPWSPGRYHSKYPKMMKQRLSNIPTFIVGYIQYPFRMPGNIDEAGMVERRFLRHLFSSMHMKFKFHEVNTTSFGMVSKNGTWDGLIGAIVHGEIDLIAFNLGMNAARSAVVDFSHPYGEEPMVILSRSGIVPCNWFLVFTPFHTELWIALMLTVLLSGLFFAAMIRIFLRVESSMSTPLVLEVSSSKWNAALACTFHAYRTFFGHAAWESPNWFSVRQYVLLLTTFGLFISVMYSSQQIMMLTNKPVEPPINTRQNLLRAVRSGTPIFIRRNSFLQMFEKFDGENSIYSDIFRAAKSLGNFHCYDGDDAIIAEQIGENGGAMVVEGIRLYGILASVKDPNLFHISSETFSKLWKGIPMKRGYRLKATIDELVDLLGHRGIWNRWYKECGHCSIPIIRQEGSASSRHSIQLEDLFGAFGFYFAGLVITGIAFAAEKMYRCQ